jgi:hypothetical protein
LKSWMNCLDMQELAAAMPHLFVLVPNGRDGCGPRET